MLHQRPGDAAEHPFPQPRMAVAAGHDEIGIAAPGFREDCLARIGGAQLVQGHLDAVAIEVAGEAGIERILRGVVSRR